jgi:two-component system sensor histidine kinase VicK
MADPDNKFQAIIDIGNHSEDGILIYDVSGEKIIYSNRAATQLTGLQENSRLIDIHVSTKNILTDDRQYVDEQLSKLYNSDFAEVEFRMQNVKDRLTFIGCSAHLIFGKTSIVLFIKDVTKAKEHESFLVEFGMKKNTMLDAVTHHIGGALRLMRQLVSRVTDIAASPGSSNEVKVVLDLVQENNTHCLVIIDQLITDEHSRSSQLAAKTSRFDISEKIKMIYDNFGKSYRDREFNLTIVTASTALNSDEFKILQIINIFTSNAIKFSNATDPISCVVNEDKNEIIISVADQGIGIPDKIKPFVFDRKSSAGRLGLLGEQSNGYGLSITKELAHLVKGKVWFTSKEGKGSTFFLSIPKASAA